jgi:phosphoribosylaminoimidazolecarboxamide formyltransferase/IMP cyclohydrolase
MLSSIRVKSALISVFNKDGLDKILKRLHDEGVVLYSTGGTRSFIESLGIPCLPVEGLTGYPSILGGRVKTLHPKVFGGILNRRDRESDREEIRRYEIPEIDLVIVDLYPFCETVAAGGGEEERIEKIDIGGISLIRAAAKNFRDVLVVASRAQYAALEEILERQGAVSTLDDRRRLAKEAFAVSSAYDSAIFESFDAGEAATGFRKTFDGANRLRYGENPHQQGVFFGNLNAVFDQLHGKEISYNNLLDIEAAVDLIGEFEDLTFAVLKHNNACGIASRPTVKEAWVAALAGDPVSAFGGILICNAPIDVDAALEIDRIFFEVILAPAYAPEALSILRQKKNRILLALKQAPTERLRFRSLLNGVLVQDRDRSIQTAADLRPATERSPDARELDDLLFANKLVKNTKSNAIVLAKNRQLCGSGAGQTSRVDALMQAIAKARAFGFDLQGAVMASDAFFPFPDCVKIAHEAGITAIVQPGGSVKDSLSIEYCNQNNLAMTFTGVRHFKH